MKHKVLILLLLLLLFISSAPMAHAAIAVDSVGNQKVTTNTNTLSITPSASANFLLTFLFINSGQSLTGVTWNGSNLTLIASAAINSGIGSAYAYYMLAPTTGTHNLVVTTSGTANGIYSMGLFYSGVKQSGQPDAFSTLTPSGPAGTSLVQTLTTVADNSWSAIIAVNDQGALAAGTNSTLRGTTMDAAVGAFDSNGPIHPAGSFSMTTTGSADVNGKGGIMVSFSPSTTVASTFAPWQFADF